MVSASYPSKVKDIGKTDDNIKSWKEATSPLENR